MIASIGVRALDACRYLAMDALREARLEAAAPDAGDSDASRNGRLPPPAPPAVFRGAAPESARTPYAVATLDGVDEEPEGARVRLGLTFAAAEGDAELLDHLTDFVMLRLTASDWRRPSPDPWTATGAAAHPPLAGSDIEVRHQGETMVVVSGARSVTERRAAIEIGVTFR